MAAAPGGAGGALMLTALLPMTSAWPAAASAKSDGRNGRSVVAAMGSMSPSGAPGSGSPPAVHSPSGIPSACPQHPLYSPHRFNVVTVMPKLGEKDGQAFVAALQPVSFLAPPDLGPPLPPCPPPGCRVHAHGTFQMISVASVTGSSLCPAKGAEGFVAALESIPLSAALGLGSSRAAHLPSRLPFARAQPPSHAF